MMSFIHWEDLKLLTSQTSIRSSCIPGTVLGAMNTHLAGLSLRGPHGWHLAENKHFIVLWQFYPVCFDGLQPHYTNSFSNSSLLFLPNFILFFSLNTQQVCFVLPIDSWSMWPNVGAWLISHGPQLQRKLTFCLPAAVSCQELAN